MVTVTSTAITTLNATTLSFGSTYQADTVRMSVIDNWFEDYGGGDRAGIGEVKFIGEVAPNPNPVIETTGLIDFGYHTSDPGTLTENLLIQNTGDEQDLIISTTLENAGTPFFLTVTDLTIPAGQSLNLPITFDAQTIGGCYHNTLSITTNDPDRPTVEVILIAAVNCLPPDPVAPDFSETNTLFFYSLPAHDHLTHSRCRHRLHHRWISSRWQQWHQLFRPDLHR